MGVQAVSHVETSADQLCQVTSDCPRRQTAAIHLNPWRTPSAATDRMTCRRQASQYQQWFDQICATRPRLSDLGVALRAGCQVVGLAVTFEPHLVTTVGERTYGSLVLPHPEPQAKYATGESDVRCRVLPSAQFELLIDVAPGLDSDRIRQLINLVFEHPTPALSVTKAAAEMQLRPILHPFVPETINNLVGHVIDHVGGPRSEELRKQFENM
jgi:hypothetical protein